MTDLTVLEATYEQAVQARNLMGTELAKRQAAVDAAAMAMHIAIKRIEDEAEMARATARDLRQTPKRGHHPMVALAQGAYKLDGRSPKFAIVVDDLITSGATMRTSLETLRAAGTVAFGFAYAGC